jgi:hypothetical protein
MDAANCSETWCLYSNLRIVILEDPWEPPWGSHISGCCVWCMRFVDGLHTSCFRTVSFKMTCTIREAFFYMINSKFWIFSPEYFFFIMVQNCFLIAFRGYHPTSRSPADFWGMHTKWSCSSIRLQMKIRKDLICCVWEKAQSLKDYPFLPTLVFPLWHNPTISFCSYIVFLTALDLT